MNLTQVSTAIVPSSDYKEPPASEISFTVYGENIDDCPPSQVAIALEKVPQAKTLFLIREKNTYSMTSQEILETVIPILLETPDLKLEEIYFRGALLKSNNCLSTIVEKLSVIPSLRKLDFTNCTACSDIDNPEPLAKALQKSHLTVLNLCFCHTAQQAETLANKIKTLGGSDLVIHTWNKNFPTSV